MTQKLLSNLTQGDRENPRLQLMIMTTIT